MRRCAVQIVGLLGFFLALCGVMYATTIPTEPTRSNWWRVVALGLVLIGLTSMALARPPLVVDFVPELGRRLGYALGVAFVVVGVLIFLLSWL